jgi:hypothetical protein
VVPHLNLLSGIDGDAMDSMRMQILGGAASCADDADTLTLRNDQYNEQQNKEAYSFVYELISKAENGGGRTWKPENTGLHLTPAPPGKGPSLWVSTDGIELYQMYGKDYEKEDRWRQIVSFSMQL